MLTKKQHIEISNLCTQLRRAYWKWHLCLCLHDHHTKVLIEEKWGALAVTLLFLNPLSTFWGTRVNPIFMLNELLRSCYSSNSYVHIWQHKDLQTTCYITGNVSCVCAVKLHSSSYTCLFRSMEWVLLIMFWPCLMML